MRKGKTSKTNFTKLAKRYLAGVLSLSMIFSMNVTTLAAQGEEAAASSAVKLGTAVDFSQDGVVVCSTGNAVEVDGTTIKLGEATSGAAMGVEIANPFSGNAELTEETLADALSNSVDKLNCFIWKSAQVWDVTTDGKDPDFRYYIAPFTSVEQAKAYVEECSNVGAEIVTDAALLTFPTQTKTDGTMQYVRNWDKTKGIKIMNLAQFVGAGDENTEVSLPYPKWENGISISAWVKASSNQPAPVFVFQNRDEEANYGNNNMYGGLAFYTDGTILYQQDDPGSKQGNGAKRNSFGAVYASDNSPAKSVGQWVYVTVNVKNAGFEVFYNGKKAEVTSNKVVTDYRIGKSATQFFNYSYGPDYNGDGTGANNFSNDSIMSWEAQRLAPWGTEIDPEYAQTAFDMLLNGKDSGGANSINIMEYVTSPSTKLYLGGDDGKCNQWLVANNTVAAGYTGFNYTAASEGMEIKDLTFSASTTDEITALDVAGKDFAVDYDVAESMLVTTGNAVAVSGDVVTLGKATSGAAMGVEVKNPFSGNEALTKEDLTMALGNSVDKLNCFIWKSAQVWDVTTDGKDPDFRYYIAPFTSVKEAQAYVEECSNVGAEIVTDAALLTFPTQTKTDGTMQYVRNWDKTKGIKIMNLAQFIGAGDEKTEVSLPYPMWKSGVTISTWVKASSDQPAPVFVFQNRDEEANYGNNNMYGGLAFYTDGTILYQQDDPGSKQGNGAKRNSFGAVYASENSPANNVGEWVYVTVSIKNAGFSVYYNGKKAEVTSNKVVTDYGIGKSATQFFNYSYGPDYNGDGTGANNFSNDSIMSWEAQRLNPWGTEIDPEYAQTAFDMLLNGKDSGGANSINIMEYVTSPSTKLYLGGDDGKCNQWLVANNTVAAGYTGFNFTEASEGMEIKGMTFETKPVTSELEVAVKYNRLTAADSKVEYDATKAENMLVTTGNAVEVSGGVVTLGEATSGAAMGVEMVNPFSGNTALTEEQLADALGNSVDKLNCFIWKSAQVWDVTTDGKDPDFRYYIAPFTSVKEAQAYVEECSNVGAEIVTDPAKLTFPTQTKTDGTVQYVRNWDKTKGIKIMNLAQFIGAGDEKTEVSLPYPKWKSGISISTWVKASSDQPAPVFVFQNRDEEANYGNNNMYGGLAFYTDGTILYQQDDPGSKQGNGAKRNSFGAVYASENSPANNVGEWVYVTVSIKNAGFSVYYNGKKAEVTSNKVVTDYGIGKSATQFFNYSYGADYNGDGTGADNFSNDSIMSWEAQRLVPWGTEIDPEYAQIAFDMLLNGKDSGGANSINIMEYVTSPSTKLFIGGDDGKCNQWLVANNTVAAGYTGFNYTKASEGMEVKDMTFSTKPISGEAEANAIYKLTQVVEAPVVPDEPTPTPTPTDEPTTPPSIEPVTPEPMKTPEVSTREAIAVYDFSVDASTEAINGVEKLNNDTNNATTSTDEYGNPTLKLGAVVEGEVGIGVRLVNPYKGKTELTEGLVAALERTGKHFNGWIKENAGTNWESPTQDKYHYVLEASNKAEAVEKYQAENKKKVEEYKRQQITSYAKSITIKGGGIKLEGNGTSVSYSAVSTGEDMRLMDIMAVNAQVYYQTSDNMTATKFDGTTGNVNIANGNNLAKVLNNCNLYADVDTIIGWTGGAVKSYAEVLEANVLGKTLEEYIGVTDPMETTNDPYTFPYPTWSKGATVSTWVKVPVASADAVTTTGEAVTTEAAEVANPTVFEFSDGTATLYLKADGTLKFMASADTTTSAGRNVFAATFEGDTPAKKAGEWVYVTVAITNDNVDVYYNGVKAEMKAKYAQGASGSKFFNYGTGYGYDIATRLSECVGGSNFRDLLKNYGTSTEYTDYTKYNFNTYENYLLMMDFLTGEKTQLFLGGNSNEPESAYSDANEGMEFGRTSFYDYPVAESVAADQYAAAKKLREVEQTPVDETLLGDADENGKVELADAVLVLKAALNITPLEGQAAINADADKNGKVELADAVLVLKAALAIITLE